MVACLVATLIAVLVPAAVSAASSSALESQVDVAAFSQRSAAYTSAHAEHRAEALERAEELAIEGQQAEAEREEGQRLAALAAAERARTTTTTAAPTTAHAPTTPSPTTTAPTATTAPPASTAPATTAAPTTGPTAEQWAALRHCESGGRYDAVNPNGLYRGAYQFSQATWDWVAGIHHPSLVGVDPAAAAPADQDAQAFALYDMRGHSPWPTCGVHLQ